MRAPIALMAWTAATATLALLASCASVPSAPRALLDEKTGVTVTVVSEPIAFARVRNDASGSARDYLMLVAVEKDVTGHYTDLLLVYRWSVSVRGDPPQPHASVGRVLIRVDDQAIELQPLEPIPIDLSRREELFVPFDSGVAIAAYAMDFATMRKLAASHDFDVSLPEDPLAAPYSLWRDGRAQLAQFVKQLNGP